MEQNLQILKDEMLKDIEEGTKFVTDNDKGMKRLNPSMAVKILGAKVMVTVLKKYVGRIDELCGL